MEGCPGGHWSLILRWAGKERPKGPRAGGDGDTGGRQQGSDTPAERGGSEQELAVAAEHTCELRAWRGRPPARPPPSRPWPRARPPADTVFPRFEHHAHTRSARGDPALPGGDTRGGRHQSGKSKGTNTPPPPACTHWQKPKHNLERPGRFQGPRRAGSLDAGKAPRRGAASAAGQARHCLGRATGTFGSEKRASPKTSWYVPGPLARDPRSTVLRRAHLASGSPVPPPDPSQDSPGQGRRTTTRPDHKLLSLCPDLPGSPAPTVPRAGARTRGSGTPLRASGLRAGSAPAKAQRRGAGQLPLGPEVPRRLPPGVAAGRGARQQERDAGGPEEQSGPHDRRRRVPPARLGSGAARGGGGCGPSPLLLAPRGANQRAPSWHAEPSRGAGDAERRRRGPRGDAANGWGSVAPRNETHKRQRRPPARRWPPGEARSPGRGQRSGTPGGGVSSSAHTPCPGLGVGFLRRAVGVRRRPREERDSGNKAGGCAPQELLVAMEPEIPVLYEKVGCWALSLLGTSRLAPSLPAGLHPNPPWVRRSVGSLAP